MIDGGLRQKFREYLPGLHWQSIETGGTGRGVPDSNYCGDGAEGWIEFKDCDARSVKLRPEQVGWLQRRARAGGRVYVAARLKHSGGPRKGLPVNELWLMSGSMAAAINENGLTITEPYILGRWQGGPSSWDWDAVRQILCS